MTGVAVVVCTANADRWSELTATVRALSEQARRPDEVILVVDHNAGLLARALHELASVHPNVRVMPNARQAGLSGARNAALESTTADIVAFLDDDSVPDSDWLDRLVTAYADPAVIAAGGVSVPVWPSGHSRPATLPIQAGQRFGELDWVVGCTYRGSPSTAQNVRNLIGCNMSFRRGVFLSVGGFSEQLGRRGRDLRSGEQTELCIRAHIAFPNARVLFEPTARVRHIVGADRLSWRYLARRCFAEGASKATMRQLVGPDHGLRDEWRYAAVLLVQNLRRELRSIMAGGGGARRRHAQQALAVVVALICSAAGYLTRRWRPLGRSAQDNPTALCMKHELRAISGSIALRHSGRPLRV